MVVGSARLPLSEVVAAPEKWGIKRQVQLSGHRAGTAATVLEVQLFLATVSRRPAPPFLHLSVQQGLTQCT